eukprot:7368170-Lingulodinium_polyedra.AAC.1
MLMTLGYATKHLMTLVKVVNLAICHSKLMASRSINKVDGVRYVIGIACAIQATRDLMTHARIAP